jgi:hypothetical protein
MGHTAMYHVTVARALLKYDIKSVKEYIASKDVKGKIARDLFLQVSLFLTLFL